MLEASSCASPHVLKAPVTPIGGSDAGLLSPSASIGFKVISDASSSSDEEAESFLRRSESVVTTSCGHKYHQKCLEMLREKNGDKRECPMCRSEMHHPFLRGCSGYTPLNSKSAGGERVGDITWIRPVAVVVEGEVIGTSRTGEEGGDQEGMDMGIPILEDIEAEARTEERTEVIGVQGIYDGSTVVAGTAANTRVECDLVVLIEPEEEPEGVAEGQEADLEEFNVIRDSLEEVDKWLGEGVINPAMVEPITA